MHLVCPPVAVGEVTFDPSDSVKEEGGAEIRETLIAKVPLDLAISEEERLPPQTASDQAVVQIPQWLASAILEPKASIVGAVQGR